MSLYQEHYISIITYIEVLVGVSGQIQFARIKEYLLSLNIIYIDQAISDLAISARKRYRVKIPGALILASAQRINAVLVTRNTKDFNASIPIVRIPYQI